ncbi:hypothetical protein AG1IA_00133 [Rhizoctonia solani AG-1 IA]|uniref:Uncharacterized protein n=1 Tax=Thanatephorus cucumeris (strain AG1-IA) TaxID=983506 RepID=L8X6D3_THACA|nr:hypothetical protein AG1IA_00133 [Rhizoctonia solani AG-1 IA]
MAMCSVNMPCRINGPSYECYGTYADTLSCSCDPSNKAQYYLMRIRILCFQGT